MRNSNMAAGLCVILAAAALGVLRADELTLTDEARLTGTVRSISKTGVVELASILSPAPLLLKAGAVSKVEFSAPESVPNPPGTLVELVNGDVIPAVVEGLDDRILTIISADAGRLEIPRDSVKSLQFGIHQRKVIYTGPRNLAEWSHDGEGGKSWSFSNKSLVANGPARLSKEFAMPEKFIFKFTLKWQANPSFQIYFADPLTPKVDEVDRYYLQFNGAGLEVKRESPQGFRSVIILPRTPDQYPDNQLEVELQVDRKMSRLYLFLNGEPEGSFIDPIPDAPVGGGVSLVNTAPAGGDQAISDIEISEFDNASTRHRSEDRGDPKTDSLISRDEDRWGGRLIHIVKEPQGTVFSFKSDFQDEPLELAVTDVSTIFFANPKAASVPEQVHPFVLRLRGEGMLRVVSCTFTETAVAARHPLLGDLKINRSGVAALERVEAEPEVKSE